MSRDAQCTPNHFVRTPPVEQIRLRPPLREEFRLRCAIESVQAGRLEGQRFEDRLLLFEQLQLPDVDRVDNGEGHVVGLSPGILTRRDDVLADDDVRQQDQL